MSVLLVVDNTKEQAKAAASELTGALERLGYDVELAPNPRLCYKPDLAKTGVELVVS